MPAINVQPLTSIEFEKGSQPTNPLPPPGQRLDGRISEELSALYPATQQETTIVLGGTVAISDVLTLKITPLTSGSGSYWADEIGPIEVTFTATTTDLDDAAAGLVAALDAAQTVVSLDDLADYQRIKDFVLWDKNDSAGADITDGFRLLSTEAGATFQVEFSATGLTTATPTTVGTADEKLPVGTVIAIDGYQANGLPKCRPVQSGDTAANVLGIVLDSNEVDPVEANDRHRVYSRGNHVVYASFGAFTALGGSAGTNQASVWVRHTAGAAPDQTVGSIDPADGGSHFNISAWKFQRDTTASGSQAVFIPHP